MRVLVVDDEQAFRNILGRCLRTWGYEVDLAADGAEAWRLLQHETAPRLVVLDWDMPGLSGLEVCRLVRADTTLASTRLVMLTATADERSAREAGADAYLPKPFRPSELRDVLRALAFEAA